MDYIESISAQPPEYLSQLERETYLKILSPQMISGNMLGRFLSCISKIKQPRLIVEIGMFTGYSALCLWEGLSKDGEMHTIEMNPEHVYLAKKYFKLAHADEQIKVHVGNAKTTIETLPDQIDLAFIDANKKENDTYYEALIPKMSKGGIILIDNILWSGKVIDERNLDETTILIRAFNKKVKNDNRVDIVQIPLRDGLTMAIKK